MQANNKVRNADDLSLAFKNSAGHDIGTVQHIFSTGVS
jgi:hypothetical protein